MIKAIIFDCFGVLTSSVYEPLKSGLPSDVVHSINELNKLADLGKISNGERNRRVSLLLDDDGRKIEMSYKAVQYNRKLLDFIISIKGNLKTSILSNSSDNSVERFFSPEESSKYFDDVVLSYQVGLAKPDREIYLLAAERLGIAPSECVFVDDRLNNIDAALDVGMLGILYKDFDQFKLELNDIVERLNA